MTDFIWPSDQDRTENDELNRVCEQLEAVMDDRDASVEREVALAAHVERLASVFRRGFYSGDDLDLDAWEVEAKSVLAETPTTSLARRDLIKQAEAVTEVAMKRPPDSVQRSWLLEEADKLRQRAEALDDQST